MGISVPARRMLLVILVGAMLYGSCRQPKQIVDTLTHISGIVTDSTTGLAIDSALISLEDTLSPSIKTYTDSSGAYALDPFGQGTFVVYCRKDSYRTRWTTIRSSSANDVFDSVDFQLSQ